MSKIAALDTTRISETLTSLVRHATLAPPLHNTQCWKFSIDTTNLSILDRPDWQRCCLIVDPSEYLLFFLTPFAYPKFYHVA